MEYVKIGKLTEEDFHDLIIKLGGRGFSPDHSREKVKNADFLLGNALIELKLIDEEGLEKDERRRKLARIFGAREPNRPVIVLRPDLLDEEGRRAYYSAMLGPIKTHIEKANKQVKKSAEKLGGNPSRVLLLVNNGYAALSHEEFRDIAVRRACNATHNIDAVVVAGLYYYSDTFDSYFFPSMDLFPIQVDRPFTGYEKLLAAWQKFGANHLTRNFIFGERTHDEHRLPVQELTYELDGVTYVKPAPPMGKPSEFFVNGRPRHNSTGITSCSAVAQTFPDFDAITWQWFKDRLPTEPFFQNSYADWLRHRRDQQELRAIPTRPFVPVRVDFDACAEWCERESRVLGTQAVCDYANSVFEIAVRRVLERADDFGDSPILTPRYVLLVTEVIGQDMANDLSSIYLVNDGLNGERRQSLMENQRVFFEHGLPLAAAFAVKHGVDIVRHKKNLTNAWV